MSLTLLPAVGALFSLLSFLVQLLLRTPTLSYYMLLCHVWLLSFRACPFLMGERGIVDLGASINGGCDMGGVEGG